MQYEFEHNEIVLEENLEVSSPASRALKIKNRGPKYEVLNQGDRKIFRWSSKHLTRNKENDEEDEGNAWKQARGLADNPDVLLSSFTSWDELAHWYDNLQQERVKPTPEIKEKAAQLAKDAPDDNARLKAIYEYVSTKYRYIGIDLGMSRYQPHFASEVMDNGYGDCKDKHTLLASLLLSAGFKVHPALINSGAEIDPDVPSPGQFNHVITVVDRPSGRLWLDTTPEVAPFGFLLASIRGKHALIVLGDSPSELVMTPALPELKSSQTFEMKASLDDHGTLNGDAVRTIQNSDVEVLFRLGFRSLPMPKWKDLVQRISYGSGFGGDVSDVNASSPEEISKPFRMSYKYTRKSYSDWENGRISPPLPVMFLPDIKEGKKPSTPTWLGVPGEITFKSSVILPKGYTLEVPKNVDVKEDFAEYHATYGLSGNTFTTERRLTFTVQEVPIASHEKYAAFRKVVIDDRDVLIAVRSSSKDGQTPSTNSDATGQTAANDIWRAVWALPNSSDSVAAQYETEARTAMSNNDMEGSVAALRSAVDKDPKFTRAWLLLGSMLSGRGQADAAIEAYRSATKTAPDEPVCYKLLGYTLQTFGKFDDAVSAWKMMIKLAPADSAGPSNLGETFMRLKRYSDAVPAFVTAVKLAPKSVNVHMLLARAYLDIGDTGSARETFGEVLKLDSSPVVLNNVAWELAEKNLDLDSAKDYAQKAVQAEEETSAKTDIGHIGTSELRQAQVLATFWDTLGWVYFRQNEFPLAEKYLTAAWRVSQSAVTGEHLGRLYEKQGNKPAALHLYQLAHSAAPLRVGIRPQTMSYVQETSEDADADLKRLGGKPDPAKAVTELNDMRTVQLPRMVEGTATAQFYVVLGPGRKVDAKFESGKESLKSAEKFLRTANFKFVFPDEGPERIARQGFVSCYPYGGCSIVLTMPSTAVALPPSLVP
jgi:cytochrome c-type biogenesis protein CcmH/NrfG